MTTRDYLTLVKVEPSNETRRKLIAQAERFRDQRRRGSKDKRVADLVTAVHTTKRRLPLSVVYCVAAGEFMKIGMSTHDGLARRLHDIQVACPYPVLLIGVTIGGREDENGAHLLLRPIHVGGEWFLIPPEMDAISADFATDAEQWRELVTRRLRRKPLTTPLIYKGLAT